MLKSLAAAALLASVPLTAGAAVIDHHAKSAKKASGTIVAAAMASPDHKTLVAAVKAADLVSTLAGPGPFTVFAPTDAAFAKLPAGTVETLVKPENKAALQSVLTYHVVPGRVTAADLVAMIGKNGGMAEVTTVQGGKLTARLMNGKVVLTDAKGGRATVTNADLMTANGIVHVTDAVSIPG